MGLKKETIKYLESEVAIYHKTKSALERGAANVPSGRASTTNYSPTDPCESLLHENRRFQRMQQLTEAIDTVFETLHSDKQELVRLYYWKRNGGLTWDGIAFQLNVSRITAIRWRDAFIEQLALELGEQ